jgi:hypothetical protein
LKEMTATRRNMPNSAYEDAIFNRGIIAGLQGDVNASRAYFQAMPDDDEQAKTARALFSD